MIILYLCVTQFLLHIAPNVYKIPTVLGSSKEGPIRSAPCYTMTGRAKQKPPFTIAVPGPGAYDAKLEGIAHRAPTYSMGARVNIPTDDRMKPGPGAHCPEKVIF